jgi:hypothetical protein
MNVDSDYLYSQLEVMDLSFGFRYDTLVARYGRDRVAAMPNWIMYVSSMARREHKDICSLPATLSHARTIWNATSWRARKYHGAFVARHDAFPRRILVDAANASGAVLCPSKAFNNMNFTELGLPSQGYSGKGALLRQTRFNVCPENSLGEGYWTEKLFEAHAAGSVPVYWGAAPPQEHVLNPARILQWDLAADPGAKLLTARIRELATDETAQAAFFAQPVLVPGASRWVEERCIDAARVFEAGLRSKLGPLLAKHKVQVRPIEPL